MSNQDEPIKEPCKLFKLLGGDTPDFCERYFVPNRDWQKFCSNDQKCHDEYWRIIYNEKKIMNRRLEKLEQKAGISKEE